LGQTVGERDNEYYVDENEVSAYAEIDDGVEPELVYGSNYNYEYKHMEE
jgi:hypothetical protein